MNARVIPLRAQDDTSAAPTTWPSVRGLAMRLLRAIAASDRISRERRYLAEMDDVMLRDIGITRADVEAELRRPIHWAALLGRQ
jgi:uncharacterized protein YjiS (DUF1127 family)